MIKKKIIIIIIIQIILINYINININDNIIKSVNTNYSPFIYEYVDVPSNSFGVGDHWIKDVNWSFIEDRCSYVLTRDGVDVSENLVVNFSYVFTNRKYSYEFTALESGYFEFTMIFDSDAVYSWIDEETHTVFFNYSDGDLFYNYSDIWNIVGQFDSDFSLVDNVFMMVLGRNCNKNVYVVLDPNFGYEVAGSSSGNIMDAVTGSDYVLTEDGCVYNITAYLKFTKTVGNYEDYAQAYVFDTSYNVVGITECKLLSYSVSTSEWVTFEFDTPQFLSSGTYILGVSCENAGGWTGNVGLDSGNRTKYYGVYEFLCDNPEDPMTPVPGSNYNVSIYATYVAGTCYGGGCTSNCTHNNTRMNGAVFTNKTTNVEDCGYHNFTIDVYDCVPDVDYVNISLAGSYHNVTAGGNDTYYCNHTSDLTPETNYTIYCNMSCQNGLIKYNLYYWFITENYCNNSIEKVLIDGIATNSSQVCKDYNDSYINISFYCNSSCDNSIEDIWLNFTTNSTHWTDENEGLFYVNYTGKTFNCEQNYSINITVIDGDDCNDVTRNYQYWFNTCDCYEEPTECNCILSEVNITNKTTCVNWSDDGYYNFTVKYNVSCGNFTGMYINISVINMSHNVSISANGTAYLNYSYNISCSMNVTWYVNLTGPQCNNTSFFWFTTCSCGGVDCADCWNDSNFISQYNLRFNSSIEYWENNGSMEIEFSNIIFMLLYILIIFYMIQKTAEKYVGIHTILGFVGVFGVIINWTYILEITEIANSMIIFTILALYLVLYGIYKDYIGYIDR